MVHALVQASAPLAQERGLVQGQGQWQGQGQEQEQEQGQGQGQGQKLL
jgi:hypothetical protein